MARNIRISHAIAIGDLKRQLGRGLYSRLQMGLVVTLGQALHYNGIPR